MFTIDRNEEITSKTIAYFIEKHRQLRPKYIEDKNFYEGNHDILHRAPRDAYKPDNRLIVNLAKYIVDTFNGFFIGVPVKQSHESEIVEESISDFRRRSNVDNNEAELAKISSIYGHAYEYLYQDENSLTHSIYTTPLDTFVVYDDTIEHKPYFAIRYYYDDNFKLVGELITENYKAPISGGYGSEVKIGDPEIHYYGSVPVIEYLENDERQSIFENVKSLINALNSAISAKADDVDYFADAYLKIIGAELDETTMTALRANRTINLAGDGSNDVTIEFLTKPNADETQENLITRLLDLIYQISMVANINDDSFGNASGVSLEFKLQPMRNLAIMKERKFKTAMQNRYKMIFNLPTNVPASMKDEWMNIQYQFTRNLPRNIIEEADTATKLEGVISKETQLGLLSFVENPKEEMTRIADETPQATGFDFEKSE